MSSPRAPLALLAFIALLPACRKPAVESYRVPKETPPAVAENATPATGGAAPAAGAPGGPAAPGGSNMANTAVATASGAGLVWTAPAHWVAKPGSAMRKGSYAIKADGIAGEADLAITAFPGDVGGDLANLNRWRGQVEQPPVGQAQFDASVQRLERNGLRIIVVDIPGNSNGAPTRILGAMIPHGGATWFVKLMGPDALVAKEKAAFTAFLDSVKPAPAAQ